MKLACPSCGKEFDVERYHAGSSELGFLYCGKDSTVLTFSVYDTTYASIAGLKMPWDPGLTAAKRQAIENALKACPCGGRFSFGNPLRCPSCGGSFSQSILKTINVCVVERRVDGEKANAWKQPVVGGLRKSVSALRRSFATTPPNPFTSGQWYFARRRLAAGLLNVGGTLAYVGFSIMLITSAVDWSSGWNLLAISVVLGGLFLLAFGLGLAVVGAAIRHELRRSTHVG